MPLFYPNPLPVANGGTGASTLTQYGVVLGNGTGVAAVLAPDASTTKVLTSGGSSANPSWAAVPFGLYNVANKTTTFSTTSANNIITCDMSGSSNASYTGTLHTAVGNTGQSITFIITVGTGVLTLATTSSQTIGGIASGVIKMATVRDSITVVSDGTNWQIADLNISCSARYYASSTSIPSVTITKVVWSTKDYDALGSMSSGTYTVTIPGKYQVNSALMINMVTSVADAQQFLYIEKNSSIVSQEVVTSFGSESQWGLMVNDIINCAAGDTLEIFVRPNGTTPSINSSNVQNFVSICRVGN